MFEEARDRMVEQQVRARGIHDERVLAAFRRVPRHLFVPADAQAQAYEDHPVPIGGGQTISQPYIVALMTNALRLQGHERVLEIGAGSGYQTAILAELALDVFAVERLPELLSAAAQRLEALGYANFHLTPGNGSLGWAGHAPYDAILVAAAAPDVPKPLMAQLVDGGRLVIPIGPAEGQWLTVVVKQSKSFTRTTIGSCVFVPLIGTHGWPIDTA